MSFPQYIWDPTRDLPGKYGTGKSRRFFVQPGFVSVGYAINVSRPLFRDNLALRRALNFAVDRPRMTAYFHGRPADQYLPPYMPGFKNAPLYPLKGPDLRKARTLANGNTRGGKVVLWAPDIPPIVSAAQVLKQNLRAIGLELEVRTVPPGPGFYARVNRQGAAWDLAAVSWIGAFPDPFDYTNSLFDSRQAGKTNVGRFSSPRYDGLMRRTATLSGEARYRAYGDLDVQLARDAAPRLQIAWEGATTFVSKRVGCIVLRPELDLAAACLK
jgi:ABC-type oligopeptide transport system substrate-binding subunit